MRLPKFAIVLRSLLAKNDFKLTHYLVTGWQAWPDKVAVQPAGLNAQDVASAIRPARNECPANRVGSSPAAAATSFTSRTTAESPCPVILPPLLTAQNNDRTPGATAPSSSLKSAPSRRKVSQYSSATSGQNADWPKLRLLAPCPAEARVAQVEPLPSQAIGGGNRRQRHADRGDRFAGFREMRDVQRQRPGRAAEGIEAVASAPGGVGLPGRAIGAQRAGARGIVSGALAQPGHLVQDGPLLRWEREG
jgi:hypothetical protein